MAKDIPFLVTNGLHKKTTYSILKIVKETLNDNDRVLVVGIPNAGKSTLINGLRSEGVEWSKGNATRVGRKAGVTRSVSEIIRILDQPKVYAYDTPGIMLPSGSDIASLVKIAATGGVNDNAVLKDDLCIICMTFLTREIIEDTWTIMGLITFLQVEFMN